MFRSKCAERSKTASTAHATIKEQPRRRAAIAFSVLTFLLAAALFALPGCGGSNSETEAVSKANVGDVVQFGDYQWRVLAKESGRALIITEDVVETRVFNEGSDATTWETCTLRAYLNGDFLNTFNDNQKKAIVDTKNANPANPDYNTPGGNETNDKVFLLSLDESNTYFATDDDRIAKYNGKAYSWWLRTMGKDDYIVSYVGTTGDASRSGVFADYTADGYAGIRPALWVKI